jgi:DNA-binding NarL/FixJ family response regulator
MSDKPRSVKAAKVQGMTIRVSFVEDDARARRIFADWLSHAADLQLVSRFVDAESALAALPREAPDVVLMDINLPGQSGIECVRQLKPLMRATQFVILTVYEDADRIFEALSAGAAGYLLKHTPREDLLASIRQVHAGGSPMSGPIARKVVQAFQRRPTGDSEATKLSDREREVLELLSRGYLYKEIADTLGVSFATVTTYGRRIYEKLHVHSRAEAAARFGKQPFGTELPVGERPGSRGSDQRTSHKLQRD